jgi:hypothetical protein
MPHDGSPATGVGQHERFGDDRSVQECLTIMNAVIAEQRARARHLDTKTGTIAGFCATALTLNVALGLPLLREDLGATGETLARLSFGIAVAALAIAAMVAVFGVMKPMDHDDLDEDGIDAYSNRPKVITPPEELRMTWLRTLTSMAISDRAAADAKSRRSTAAVVFLALGVLGIVGQAGTLLAMSKDQTSPRPTPPRPAPDTLKPQGKSLNSPGPELRPKPDPMTRVQEGQTRDN